MWLQSDVAGVGVILKALSFSSLVSSLRGFRQLVVEIAGALKRLFLSLPGLSTLMASEKLDFLHGA